MEIENRCDLTRLKATRRQYKKESQIDDHIVLQITEYDEGIIELQTDDNTYFRFDLAEFEKAVMAARTWRKEDV